jgi:hypothetical protein
MYLGCPPLSCHLLSSASQLELLELLEVLEREN